MGKDPDSPPDSEYSDASSRSRDESLSPIEPRIPTLNVTVEQQAICHFVSNYVLLPRQGSARGFMEFLIPLLKTEQGNQHLHEAFNACSLASLGNRGNAYGTDIGDKALVQYTRALKSIQMALRDPEMAKSDSTLAAILMLGLFEAS